MNTILKYNETINIKLLTIKKQINISNEFTNYPIKYDNNNLIIQTPIMYIPFGINKYNNKSYIDISFINSDKNDMKKLKSIILNINNHIKKKFKKKNIKFLSSFKSTEFYPDRLRLSFYDDILVFSESKKLLNLDYIKSKSYVKLLIIPQFIWTNNNSYGIVWNILQMKIYSKPMLDTYSFIDDDINIDKYIKMIKCGVPSQAVKNKMSQDKIDSSLLNKYLPKSEIVEPILKPFKRIEKKVKKENKSLNTNSGFRMTMDELKNIKLKKTKSRFPQKFTHMNPFVNPDELLKMKNKIMN